MRRFIKKQCIIMATLCMAVGVVGCGGSNSGNDAKSSTQATVQENKDEAKTVYKELNDAVEKSTDVADGIITVWYYGIYDADDGEGNGEVFINDLCAKLGVDTQTFIDINNKNNFFEVRQGFDGLYRVRVDSFSNVVNCYIECRKNDGTYDDISKMLDDAKNSIKNIPESASYYSKLKEHYVEANSFYEFCLSPTGNYDDAGNKVEEFRSKCQGYKSDLSFDLE